MSEYKCHFCPVCNGRGCIEQMPGMGGPNKSINFIHNYDSWEQLASELPKTTENASPDIPIRLAPITGAVENIGYDSESSFYFDLINACVNAGIKLSIGDGTPDYKLQYGIQAVQNTLSGDKNNKAAVFIKPYPDIRIMERIDWANPVAEIYGIDIDSYNIITMRELVHLEKKTAAQLLQIKHYVNEKGFPFAIKGIFTKEDIKLVKEVRPDICYISNHGGRVETREGGTADFLAKYGSTLKQFSGRLWVDGGIRTKEHIRAAAFYDADEVLIGRPIITALCKNGSIGVSELLREPRKTPFQKVFRGSCEL